MARGVWWRREVAAGPARILAVPDSWGCECLLTRGGAGGGRERGTYV